MWFKDSNTTEWLSFSVFSVSSIFLKLLHFQYLLCVEIYMNISQEELLVLWPGTKVLDNPINQTSSQCAVCYICLNSVRLFTTLWTAAWRAPLSVKFSRQEYWSEFLPCPPPGSSYDQETEPMLFCHLHWQGGFFINNCHLRNPFVPAVSNKMWSLRAVPKKVLLSF